MYPEVKGISEIRPTLQSLGTTFVTIGEINIHLETWGLFDCASSSWNNVECQLDATR